MKQKLILITSLDQLQVGDLIEAEASTNPVKILDRTTHLVALSFSNDLKGYHRWVTLKDLTDDGFQLQVTDEPWKPKEGQDIYYWPVVSLGKLKTSFKLFNGDFADYDRLAAGICFKTKAEALVAAQKMLDAIKPNQT